jgi:hypothetical protein
MTTTTIDYFAEDWEDIADKIEEEEKQQEQEEEKINEETMMFLYEQRAYKLGKHRVTQTYSSFKPVEKTIIVPPKVEEVKIKPPAWGSVNKNTRVSYDYCNSFPSLNPVTEKELKKERPVTEKELKKESHKKERVVKKSKNNMFSVLDDDDDDDDDDDNEENQLEQKQTTRVVKEKLSKPSYESKPKSRLCRCVTDGIHCSHGERCRFAHYLSELNPDSCRQGLKCRCITIGYDKSVKNNQRSRRVCMYKHDESTNDYIRRTGLDKYASITVPSHLRTQAVEMARVAGVTVRSR